MWYKDNKAEECVIDNVCVVSLRRLSTAEDVIENHLSKIHKERNDVYRGSVSRKKIADVAPKCFWTSLVMYKMYCLGWRLCGHCGKGDWHSNEGNKREDKERGEWRSDYGERDHDPTTSKRYISYGLAYSTSCCADWQFFLWWRPLILMVAT